MIMNQYSEDDCYKTALPCPITEKPSSVDEGSNLTYKKNISNMNSAPNK